MTDDKDVGQNPDSEDQDDKQSVPSTTDNPDDAKESAEQSGGENADASAEQSGGEDAEASAEQSGGEEAVADSESKASDSNESESKDSDSNESEDKPKDAGVEGDLPSPDEFGVTNAEDASQEDAEAAMLEMLDELPNEGPGSSAEEIDFTSATASKAEFQQLQQPAGTPDVQNIDLLMDVDLPVSIELGRTKMPIAEILALGPGSVVELNKLAGEPVDLLVNHKVVAKGEVVVVDENFGLRVTQLMTPEERLKALAEE